MAGGLDAGGAWARLGATGFVYPLDMFAYLVRESPLLVGAVLTLLLARSAGMGGPWSPHERALHVLWMGWVLWFGVIESGITQRYLLLPVTFMLAALAIDLAAVVARRACPWQVAAPRPALAAAVVLLVSFESWRGPAGAERRWVDARPTLDVAPPRLRGARHTISWPAPTSSRACSPRVGPTRGWRSTSSSASASS